jgi:hypothetical protein
MKLSSYLEAEDVLYLLPEVAHLIPMLWAFAWLVPTFRTENAAAATSAKARAVHRRPGRGVSAPWRPESRALRGGAGLAYATYREIASASSAGIGEPRA